MKPYPVCHSIPPGEVNKPACIPTPGRDAVFLRAARKPSYTLPDHGSRRRGKDTVWGDVHNGHWPRLIGKLDALTAHRILGGKT